jgi:hypothetical protein
MAANINIDEDIDKVLTYCGFDSPDNRKKIAEDGFGSFKEIATLQESDIDHLAHGFSKRTAANGRLTFGLRRTNLMKNAIHWVLDFKRISRQPSLDGIEDMQTFRDAIEVSRERARNRKHKKDEPCTVAPPPKLRSQKDWVAFDRSLRNNLSTMEGQGGVSLDYIIRSDDAPDYSSEEDGDFDGLTVLCAPLSGPAFDADSNKVYQLLLGYVQGGTADNWVRKGAKTRNGRVAYLALKAHYSGEAHKTLSIKSAESLRNTLQYKNERTMSFEVFQTNMELMRVGFSDHGETLTEPQVIRLLFAKVQHPSLETVKSSLQISYDLQTDNGVDYDFIVNSFAAAVAGLPEHVPAQRNASGVDSSKGEAPSNGIRGADGEIYTGHYDDYKSLSSEDKKAILEERQRLNIGPKKTTSHPNHEQETETAEQIAETAELTKQIAELLARVRECEKRQADDSDDDSDDQLRGRQAKKGKKQD